MSACSNCGCDEIDRDSARGNAVCTQCGAVVESQIIISDVQFQENATGGSSIVGQFVSMDGRNNYGGNNSSGYGKDSRVITLQKGKSRIQKLASQLNMTSHCSDMAYNYFKLAVCKGLTKGRKSNYVAAACLYIVCRTEKKPLMLLDFSDQLKTDVYTLGHTYLQISKELYISIPAIDPSLYIERYAHKLEFGEKTLEVCRTATRIVSRMSRDWMVQGRRPSGLCGAALLVAARIFNFNRTTKDIMKVVRIGEGTIRKRLVEFEKTPSSKLTIEEFQTINLEQDMDPPCFTEGRRKAKLVELEEREDISDLLELTEKLKGELEIAIQEIIDRKNRQYKKYLPISDEGLVQANVETICTDAPSLTELDQELEQYKHLLDNEEEITDGFTEKETKINLLKFKNSQIKSSNIPILNNPHSSNNSINLNGITPTNLDNLNNSNLDPELERLEEIELADILQNNKSLTTSGCIQTFGIKKGRETLGHLKGLEELDGLTGIKKSIKECLDDTDAVNSTADDIAGELDITGLNEKELDDMLLNEEEVKIKTAIWMRENADFLKDFKEKEQKIKENIEQSEHKKKRKPRKPKQRIEASSAKEAIEKIIQEKKLSNKINYDVLLGFNINQQSTITTTNYDVNNKSNLKELSNHTDDTNVSTGLHQNVNILNNSVRNNNEGIESKLNLSSADKNDIENRVIPTFSRMSRFTIPGCKVRSVNPADGSTIVIDDDNDECVSVSKAKKVKFDIPLSEKENIIDVNATETTIDEDEEFFFDREEESVFNMANEDINEEYDEYFESDVE